MKRCEVGIRRPDQPQRSPAAKDKLTAWFALVSLPAVLPADRDDV